MVRRKPKVKLTKFLLGQIDPFDERVAGAKIPDANTTPSSTSIVNDEVNINGGGIVALAGMAFNPFIKNTTVTANPASATSWTWPAAFAGTDSSRLSAINTNYNAVRTVAHGVRLSCPVAPTSVTGFCHVALYVQSLYGDTTWDLPVDLSGLNQCVWYKRYPLAMLTQRTLTIVNKITDCTSTMYMDSASDRASVVTSGNDMQLQTNGFGTIVVIVEGIPVSSATQLSAENIIHLECLPKFSGLITPSPAADYNPQELAATSRASSALDATTLQGEEDRRINQAVNAVLQGAQNAASGFADYVYGAAQQGAYNFGYGVVQGLAGVAGGMIGGGIPGVTNMRLVPYRGAH